MANPTIDSLPKFTTVDECIRRLGEMVRDILQGSQSPDVPPEIVSSFRTEPIQSWLRRKTPLLTRISRCPRRWQNLYAFVCDSRAAAQFENSEEIQRDFAEAVKIAHKALALRRWFWPTEIACVVYEDHPNPGEKPNTPIALVTYKLPFWRSIRLRKAIFKHCNVTFLPRHKENRVNFYLDEKRIPMETHNILSRRMVLCANLAAISVVVALLGLAALRIWEPSYWFLAYLPPLMLVAGGVLLLLAKGCSDLIAETPHIGPERSEPNVNSRHDGKRLSA